MRSRALALGVSSAILAAGCGGGDRPPRPAPPAVAPPPVAVQVRDALRAAVHRPPATGQVAPQLPVARPPQLPYVAVVGCRGPRSGGAGTYLCTTRPRGPRGVSTVIVDVTAAGSWSTRQLTVRTTVRGRAGTAAQGVFGFGLRLPR